MRGTMPSPHRNIPVEMVKMAKNAKNTIRGGPKGAARLNPPPSPPPPSCISGGVDGWPCGTVLCKGRKRGSMKEDTRMKKRREGETPDPVFAGSTRKERDRILDEEEAGGGSNPRWGQETLVREEAPCSTPASYRRKQNSICVLVHGACLCPTLCSCR